MIQIYQFHQLVLKWSSGYFRLERGVGQGCPLSPYIFIPCAEILASAVRKDKNIKGIKINGVECKISQYADDTTLFLDGSKTSLQASLDSLDHFSIVSGLKVNSTKTDVLWIGTLKGRRDVFFQERKLKWANDSIRALGVHFLTNEEQAIKQILQKN